MAKNAVSEKSLAILEFLKANKDKNMTFTDIAEALDMPEKSVNGIITSGLQRKGLAERVPAEIELPDGTHKAVKFIRVTEAGMAYNHDAAVAADEVGTEE